jgi:hypothetical protein
MIAKGQGGMWETRHLKEGTNQGQGYLLFGGWRCLPNNHYLEPPFILHLLQGPVHHQAVPCRSNCHCAVQGLGLRLVPT